MYGLSASDARRIHGEMVNGGEWPYVRSWDAEVQTAQKESDSRIVEYFKSLEDGIGEGQPL
jgi:hypothetical protein